MNKCGWIYFSASIWIIVSFSLLYKAFHLFSLKDDLLFISLAFLIGFLKGKFVLSKSAKRLIDRIQDLKSPIRIRNVYPTYYFFLVLFIGLMGVFLKKAPINSGLKGVVNLCVSIALLRGSCVYFSEAKKIRSYL